MSVSTGPRRGLMINALTGDNFDSAFRAFLRAIDALLLGAVVNLTTSTPPGSPANGDAYIVKATGTGAWAGHDNAIAVWTTDNPSGGSGEWEFYAAARGMIVCNIADSTLYFWSGTAWTAVAGGGGGGSTTLAALTDVSLTSPANNDLLTYESASSLWKNKPAAGGGGGGALFEADGDNLTSWTIVGTVAAASASSGFTPADFAESIVAAAGGASYAFISTGLTSLAGMIIEVDIAADSSGAIVDFLFGCNVAGTGPMIRVDGRGGSDKSGLALAAAWNSPTTVLQFIYTAGGQIWYRWKMSISADGTKCTWAVNGIVQGMAAITLSGDYVGIFGDAGSAGGRFANLRIYKG